jgi:D-alanyl-D-alanine carboxypeptidase
MSQLQTALEAVVGNPDINFPGAVLYIQCPGIGSWSGAAGLGEIETATAMKPDNRFRAGSVMKSFVAMTTLQLVEEGCFSLDDPMTVVLPDHITSRVAASGQITVLMLLNHTSGIPEWLTDAVMAEISRNPTKVRTIDEYLQISETQEPYFPPGEGFTYSNTNYNLLESVIEQATNRSWREEIHRRIIKPLRLNDTLLPEPGDLSLPDNCAHGYADISGNLFDFSRIDPSMAGAAGGHALVSTTRDLVRFLDAALAGELFREARTLGKMLTYVDMPQSSSPAVSYGLGIMRYELSDGIEMLGHAGTTGGHQCFAYSLPAQRMIISGMINVVESNHMKLLYPALEILIPGFSP